MTDLDFLIPPALAFLVAAGSPGPATLAVATTAMAAGPRAALAIGTGLALSLGLWGMVAALGLGAAMLAWAPALTVLRIAGGAFLLWLAWKAARSALSPAAPVDPDTLASNRYFLSGFALNLTNPKALLAWGAVIAIGLPDGAGPGAVATITVVCAGLGWLIYVVYALIFSRPGMMAAYARTRRWVDRATAALFAAAGLRLLTWRPAV